MNSEEEVRTWVRANERLDTCRKAYIEAVKSEREAFTAITSHRRSDGESQLTHREIEIAKLIVGQNCCNKEIATALNISVRTVKYHISNILGKLGIEGRGQMPTAIVINNLECIRIGTVQ